MSSDAVVELPPFMRCSNASIFFSNASNFAFEICLADFERGLLLLWNVNERREVDTVREKEDEINCWRDVSNCWRHTNEEDETVRGCLHRRSNESQSLRNFLYIAILINSHNNYSHKWNDLLFPKGCLKRIGWLESIVAFAFIGWSFVKKLGQFQSYAPTQIILPWSRVICSMQPFSAYVLSREAILSKERSKAPMKCLIIVHEERQK